MLKLRVRMLRAPEIRVVSDKVPRMLSEGFLSSNVASSLHSDPEHCIFILCFSNVCVDFISQLLSEQIQSLQMLEIETGLEGHGRGGF